jgi:hypothetical protein
MINPIKIIILKQKLKKNKTPWIKVSKDAVNEYRYTTNKNRDLDDFSIHMKIIRAFYSGHATSINDKRIIVEYGYLRIKLDRVYNKITKIHNSRSNNRNGHIDMDIKNEITSIYVDVFGGVM